MGARLYVLHFAKTGGEEGGGREGEGGRLRSAELNSPLSEEGSSEPARWCWCGGCVCVYVRAPSSRLTASGQYGALSVSTSPVE